MVTVEPFAALPLPGTWLKTVPLGYWAGPDPCWTLTWKPAWVRIWLAVAWESPTTDGTVTAPPETVMITVDPGGAVPWLGLWAVTWPSGADEVGSFLTWALKPAVCSADSAAVSDWPTTFGTATGAAPLETNKVTTVFAGTLLPSGGLELITRPCLTPDEAWSTTVERRCWAWICCCACATGSPFTSGTA